MEHPVVVKSIKGLRLACLVWRTSAIISLSAIPFTCLRAAETGASSQLDPVVVTGKRQQDEVEERSYRKMLKAMEQFDEYRQHHPDAVLRFRIEPRREGVDTSKLHLRIEGDFYATRVELAPDLTFTLPVSSEMREQDAMVRSNMPVGSLTWRIQITREGGDAQRRVLGDLRWECKLDLNVAELRRGIDAPWLVAALGPADRCSSPSLAFNTYGERPLFSVHLTNGTRRESLRSDYLHGENIPESWYPRLDWPYLARDRVFRVPIADAAWPDDTLVEIEYVE